MIAYCLVGSSVLLQETGNLSQSDRTVTEQYDFFSACPQAGFYTTSHPYLPF